MIIQSAGIKSCRAFGAACLRLIHRASIQALFVRQTQTFRIYALPNFTYHTSVETVLVIWARDCIQTDLSENRVFESIRY
jgi:hypothetical protein